jgi:hypothetical protein
MLVAAYIYMRTVYTQSGASASKKKNSDPPNRPVGWPTRSDKLVHRAHFFWFSTLRRDGRETASTITSITRLFVFKLAKQALEFFQ